MNQKDASISQETRDKVLKIAKEYHYSPYSSILPGTGKTFLIGVLFRSMNNIQKTLSGILDVTGSLGYQIVLADSDDDLETEKKALSGFCKNKVDAVLWEAVGESSFNYTAKLDEAKIPYLIFNPSLPNAVNIDYHAKAL